MSDTDDPKPPRTTGAAGQPLPRLWKTEPETPPDEFEVLPETTSTLKSEKKVEPPPPPAAAPVARASSGAPRPRKEKHKEKPAPAVAADDDKKPKKVLKEDTPALDTIESRQRVRLIVMGLVVFCVLMTGWSVYHIFLANPNPIDVSSGSDGAVAQKSPEAQTNPEREARFMLNLARDRAKEGHTEQAIAMLKKVTTVYKGTPSAVESKAALARSTNNLELFPEHPIVVPQVKPTAPAPAPTPAPPPTVIAANPTPAPPPTGPRMTTVVLPANPPETIVAPSELQEKMASAANQQTIAQPAMRALPPGFHAKADASIHESGWPAVIVGERDGAPMILIPSGTFVMGNDEGTPPESPAHTVRLSTFYIDQHEVTNRQFRLFLAESHYRGQPPGKWGADEKSKIDVDSLPIVMVNAGDAKSFADWAGKQLPTEAQWELAARSTESRLFPWGNEPNKSFKPRVLHQIAPIMSLPEDVSAYGVFDMAGNVVEWTRDWYDSKYFKTLTARTTDNPTGPASRGRSTQVQQVVKGGSKTYHVAYREGMPTDKRLPYLGFRCVLTVETTLPPGPQLAQPNGPAQAFPPANLPGSSRQPAASGKSDVPF